VLVLLMAFPLAAHAQDAAETSTWHWPETGIRFEYPADWSFEPVEGFEFVLQASDEIPRGMGLQVFPLAEGDTLSDVFESISEEMGVEAEIIELGGVDAMMLALPEDSGRQSLLVGYTPDEASLVLISFSSATEIWDDFSGQIDQVMESAIITEIALDAEILNEQMLANFEADQTLSVGEADAGVLLVEVIDFSCPHCANYAPSIERLIQDYVMSGDMKIEFHTVTFVGHELSVVAANAQYCATSLGFGWDMHDLLFHLQLTEGRDFFSNENLIAAVTSAELDAEGFAECLEANTYNDLVQRDAEIAEGLDVQGTPAVLLAVSDDEPAHLSGADGEPIRGGVRLVVLYQQIDALLPTR
jgi:predicted DsbA family dithiol-disulfide isomerase